MILPDTNNFLYKDGIIGGDECVLIVPTPKCEWTEETLMFRSIIVRKSDNKIISRSFSKFFNWAEQPELNKFPNGPFDAIEKIDGSLIIWGIHNDELIHRTRGTFNAENMENGGEIEFLKTKYPKFIKMVQKNPGCSILTEWETKSNVIVINRVNEPTLTLVGIIHNDSGVLMTQSQLDYVAETHEIARPNRYHYNSIAECISDVELWEGKEGVVLYSEDGQFLRKCKSEWYLQLHRLATGMTSVGQVLDVFMASPKFTQWEDFYNYVKVTMDYEIAEKCKDHIIKICDAYSHVVQWMGTIKDVIGISVKNMESRKLQAQEIQKRLVGWQKSYAFLCLDNREMNYKLLKTAIETYL